MSIPSCSPAGIPDGGYPPDSGVHHRSRYVGRCALARVEPPGSASRGETRASRANPVSYRLNPHSSRLLASWIPNFRTSLRA